MNVKRFTARTSRDALGLVKQAFGQEAVVLSTRPCAEGVEVLAMAPDGVAAFEAASAPAGQRLPPPRVPSLPAPPSAMAESTVAQDAERLAMSTLSFQDYVRERMLRRRRAEMQGQAGAGVLTGTPASPTPAPAPVAAAQAAARLAAAVQTLTAVNDPSQTTTRVAPAAPVEAAARRVSAPRMESSLDPADPFDAFTQSANDPGSPSSGGPAGRAGDGALLHELREMRSLIEQRFGALAYLEKMQREPRQAQLSQRLLEAGFSPMPKGMAKMNSCQLAIIRKWIDGGLLNN